MSPPNAIAAPPSVVAVGSKSEEKDVRQMAERQLVAYDTVGHRETFVLDLGTDARGSITMRENAKAIDDVWQVGGVQCPLCVFRRRWAFSAQRGYGYAFVESCLHERSDIDPQVDRAEDEEENGAVGNLLPDDSHIPILGDLVVIKIRMGNPDQAAEAAAAEKGYMDAEILDIDESELPMVDRLVRRYALYDSIPRNLHYEHSAVDSEEDDFEVRNFVGWTAAMTKATVGGEFDAGVFTQSYMREARRIVQGVQGGIVLGRPILPE